MKDQMSGCRSGKKQGSCWSCLLWIGICLLAGAMGSAWTASSVGSWYPTLNKPPFNPPNGVFAPVWTTLYVMMGMAAWFVWNQRREQAINAAMIFFFVQLALNVAWSGIFFGLRSPGWAFVEIIVLWLMILATAFAFRRISSMAFVLMLPYLAWVSFAVILNAVIWRLN